MKNPYIVLGISQDASKVDIVKAQVKALRLKKFNPKEIASAQMELRNPARRLAVDFTFPVSENKNEFDTISSSIKSNDIDINKLNADKYKS